MGVSPSIDITPILHKLSLEHKAVHKIRLEFKADGLYCFLRDNEYKINKANDEIFLDKIRLDSLFRYALVVISPYDLVMVHVNSSDEPYPANFEGMTILGNHLYVVYLYLTGIAKIIPIPSYLYWIVKEWQVNKDAKLSKDSGLFFQGLNFTWKDMQHGLSRIYLKEKADGQIVLRGEHDEKVDKPYLKILSDALYSERSYYDERLDEILRLVRTLVDQNRIKMIGYSDAECN
jgi:hypothetical protein